MNIQGTTLARAALVFSSQENEAGGAPAEPKPPNPPSEKPALSLFPLLHLPLPVPPGPEDQGAGGAGAGGGGHGLWEIPGVKA